MAYHHCERCNGSGEIGIAMRGTREVPGPVPEDARRFRADDCPDCGGTGEISSDEGDEGEGEPDDWGSRIDHEYAMQQEA